LRQCNVFRKKFFSGDYTRARSGRGGGVGNAEFHKIQSYGKVGFEVVKRRIKQMQNYRM
jgi:hypothetical protein